MFIYIKFSRGLWGSGEKLSDKEDTFKLHIMSILQKGKMRCRFQDYNDDDDEKEIKLEGLE